ncbi:MAG: hypothetical protein MZW92_18200 [Comamonadaceae bacterium]|nr:hypothetical protein [Comamonadaceae bacterium]
MVVNNVPRRTTCCSPWRATPSSTSTSTRASSATVTLNAIDQTLPQIAQPHRQAGRHALRTRRPQPRGDARFALPAQLQGRLREHVARHHRHGVDQHPDRDRRQLGQHVERRRTAVHRQRQHLVDHASRTSRKQPLLGDAGEEHQGPAARNRQDPAGGRPARPSSSGPTRRATTGTGAAACTHGGGRARQPAPQSLDRRQPASPPRWSNTSDHAWSRRTTFREAASVIAQSGNGRGHRARHVAAAREGSGIPRPGPGIGPAPGADRGDHRRGDAERRIPAGHRLVAACAPDGSGFTIAAHQRSAQTPADPVDTLHCSTLSSTRASAAAISPSALRFLESFGTVKVLSSPTTIGPEQPDRAAQGGRQPRLLQHQGGHQPARPTRRRRDHRDDARRTSVVRRAGHGRDATDQRRATRSC